MGSRGTGAENLVPARSESLYRLSYPSPSTLGVVNVKLPRRIAVEIRFVILFRILNVIFEVLTEVLTNATYVRRPIYGRTLYTGVA